MTVIDANTYAVLETSKFSFTCSSLLTLKYDSNTTYSSFSKFGNTAFYEFDAGSQSIKIVG